MIARLVVFALILASTAACGAAAPQKEAMYAPPASGGSYGSETTVVAAQADAPSFFRGRSASDSSAATPAASQPQYANIDQKLVKNAWLTIQVRDEKMFEPAVAQAEQIARRLDGYVANQTRSSIVFKVPTSRLDEALAALSEIGKVKHRDVSAVDVTSTYVDMQIRIENLRKVRDRLQELVQQGRTVEEILAVEKELARVTTELEALEGQMRLLENQVSFATVNVTFKERVLPGPLGWVFYGGYHVVKWLFVWD